MKKKRRICVGVSENGRRHLFLDIQMFASTGIPFSNLFQTQVYNLCSVASVFASNLDFNPTWPGLVEYGSPFFGCLEAIQFLTKLNRKPFLQF